MSEKFLYVSNDQTQQSKAVDMLCRCFDEWIDFSQQYGKCFPFHEESFIAVDDSENLLGHVGIMPFEIFYDNEKSLKVAGLASVGVTPEARNRNIAHNLCTLAGNWAEKQGFDLMLLYTGAARVYEKSSWECFTPPYTMLKNPEKSSALTPVLVVSTGRAVCLPVVQPIPALPFITTLALSASLPFLKPFSRSFISAAFIFIGFFLLPSKRNP